MAADGERWGDDMGKKKRAKQIKKKECKKCKKEFSAQAQRCDVDDCTGKVDWKAGMKPKKVATKKKTTKKKKKTTAKSLSGYQQQQALAKDLRKLIAKHSDLSKNKIKEVIDAEL